jgi:hypothetical protein
MIGFMAALQKVAPIDLRKWTCRAERAKRGMPREDDAAARALVIRPFDGEPIGDDPVNLFGPDCEAFWEAVHCLGSADRN